MVPIGWALRAPSIQLMFTWAAIPPPTGSMTINAMAAGSRLGIVAFSTRASGGAEEDTGLHRLGSSE